MNMANINPVGCLLFEVDKFYGDDRGFFTEIYRTGWLNQIGFPKVQQVNVSKSQKATIRGMHFNIAKPQAKMIRVINGAVIDVVIDLRMGSPKYGVVEMFKLDKPEQCLLIPEGYAHGFWALENDTVFLYGCSDVYAPETDRGISLLDQQFEFPWRGIFDKEKYVATNKDLEWPTFDLAKKVFTYIPNDRFGCRLGSA